MLSKKRFYFPPEKLGRTDDEDHRSKFSDSKFQIKSESGLVSTTVRPLNMSSPAQRMKHWLVAHVLLDTSPHSWLIPWVRRGFANLVAAAFSRRMVQQRSAFLAHLENIKMKRMLGFWTRCVCWLISEVMLWHWQLCMFLYIFITWTWTKNYFAPLDPELRWTSFILPSCRAAAHASLATWARTRASLDRMHA